MAVPKFTRKEQALAFGVPESMTLADINDKFVKAEEKRAKFKKREIKK